MASDPGLFEMRVVPMETSQITSATLPDTDLKPGMCILMGAQTVPWQVLDVNPARDTALLIATEPVCRKAYEDHAEEATWETCSLRKWLNGEFFDTNFSDIEKSVIIETRLENPNYPDYPTPGCAPTNDRIFLLSSSEEKRYCYFCSDNKDYLWTADGLWLRSPGVGYGFAACVDNWLSLDEVGEPIDCEKAVFPAFTIQISSYAAAAATIHSRLRPGSRIRFGSGGRILWRILEINRTQRRVQLLAEDTVCNRTYHDRREDVTWETCSLRAWLNGEYYETCFSEAEKAAILDTDLENPDNPEHGTPGGHATRDRIYLLSIEDADKYFQTFPRANNRWWWLRSPGDSSHCASFVEMGGDIDCGGIGVTGGLGVRPALTVDADSDVFQACVASEGLWLD